MPADITQGQVLVNQGNEDENPNLLQRWHFMTPQITFGAADGSQTYPTNGIPMPANINFRLNFALYRIWFEPVSPIDGKVYRYDPANNTIRIFTGGTEFSGAIPVITVNAFIIGA